MKLLVTGAGGQLGGDMVAQARARGMEVTAVGRSEADLSRPGALSGALADVTFDVLVNCAAHHGTEAIEADPRTAMTVNGHAVGALAALCERRGARLVQVSTDYVFRGDLRRPYTEDDAPAPVNLYGLSKLFGEGLAVRAHPEGTLVVRTASLFGAAAAVRGSGNFLEAILSAAEAGRPLKVVDDVVMSPTNTADLAAGILDLVVAAAPAGTYHVVNGGAASWHELATAAVDGWGLQVGVEAISSAEQQTTAARPVYSVLDTGRAAEFGVRLPPWTEALADYIDVRRAAVQGSTGVRGS